jgi:probable HAF family extracellular repeat protein
MTMRLPRKLVGLGVLVGVLVLAVFGSTSPPVLAERGELPRAYAVRILPTDNVTMARSVNDRGQVVGSWMRPDPTTHVPTAHAFRWDVHHGMRDLGVLPGTSESGATDINEAGVVVGGSGNDLHSGRSRAFIWDEERGMRDLGTPPGWDTSATAINEDGQVAGTASFTVADGYRVSRAYRWDREHGIRLLEAPPEFLNTYAVGINDAGHVTGPAFEPSSGFHGILWTGRGRVQDIGTLPGEQGILVHGINNHDQVVGEANVAGGPVGGHAFLWESKRGMRNLGVLPLRNHSAAYSINDRGQAVGASPYAFGYPKSGTAVMYFNGRVIDLNTLVPIGTVLELAEAVHITDSGLIAGSGYLPDPNNFFCHCTVRAFLLTPTDREGEGN